jgi:hypothetical protein
MKRRGITFLEMLSMELKGDGLYVSRGLSFRCVGCDVRYSGCRDGVWCSAARQSVRPAARPLKALHTHTCTHTHPLATLPVFQKC